MRKLRRFLTQLGPGLVTGAADDDPARLRPSPSVEVGVARLPVRSDAARPRTFDPELDRDPAHPDPEAPIELEGRTAKEAADGN